jgi:hypothetical protein
MPNSLYVRVNAAVVFPEPVMGQVSRDMSFGFEIRFIDQGTSRVVGECSSRGNAIGPRIRPEIIIKRMVLLDNKNKMFDRYRGRFSVGANSRQGDQSKANTKS